MDGPILLEDFRDIAANLVAEGRMPEDRMWVDDFRARVEDAQSAAMLEAI